jgi:excisionase family DNA binding protein
MNNPNEESPSFPLLEQVSRLRGLPLLPMYKTRDVAALFGVSPRTIYDWIRDGRLPARDLPGRYRFLPQDIEDLLAASGQRHEVPEAEPLPAGVKARQRTPNGLRARRSA